MAKSRVANLEVCKDFNKDVTGTNICLHDIHGSLCMGDVGTLLLSPRKHLLIGIATEQYLVKFDFKYNPFKNEFIFFSVVLTSKTFTHELPRMSSGSRRKLMDGPRPTFMLNIVTTRSFTLKQNSQGRPKFRSCY